MRKFTVRFSGEVTLELADEVISVVDDEWRANLYQLDTVDEIVQHLAYNVVVNNAELSHLDGWADQPDSNMKASRVDIDDWEIEEEK